MDFQDIGSFGDEASREKFLFGLEGCVFHFSGVQSSKMAKNFQCYKIEVK